VDLVASECAPLGQSCGCPSGSIESGDKCYLGGGVARNFGLARDACSLQGGGWSLAQIDDATENDIAGSLVGAGGLGSGWVGGVATGPNQWLWQASAEVFFDSNNGGLQPGYTFEGWGAGEPQADLDFSMGGYGIAIDASGRWRDERLSTARDYVCEGPPNALLAERTGVYRGAAPGRTRLDGRAYRRAAAGVKTDPVPVCRGLLRANDEHRKTEKRAAPR
jgi:hypothetical protein